MRIFKNIVDEGKDKLFERNTVHSGEIKLLRETLTTTGERLGFWGRIFTHERVSCEAKISFSQSNVKQYNPQTILVLICK